MSDWDTLAASVAAATRWSAVEAQRALDEVLQVNGGSLPRNDALVLAERTGWSVRQMYRWKADRDRRAELPPEDATFIERVAEWGPKAFVFDDLALTMLYLVGGNMARFREEVTAAGYPMPSLPTLSRLWRSSVPRHVRDGAKHGQRNRHSNLFFTRHSATAPDEAWQLDAFSLDLRVLVETPDGFEPANDDEAATVVVARGGQWFKYRPQLLLLIDDCSRFVTAWALLDHEPTAADTCALLADGFEVRPADDGSGVAIGGVCDKLVCDNATAFRSQLVEGMMVSIGAHLSPTPVYSPAAKGKVERAGQTIQARIVTGIAGVVSPAERWNTAHALEVSPAGWLEFNQLEAIVAAVIYEYNYLTIHSALGRTPFEVYSEREGPRRTLSDETLAKQYLPLARAGGRRKVQPSGVFAFGEYWLDPNLDTDLIGSEVTVKSLHHRLDRLAIFDSDDKFAGMVRRAVHLGDGERRALVADRLDQTMAVARYAKRARAALEARTAALATGEGTTLLEASSRAVAEAGPGEVVAVDERGAPSEPKAQPKRLPPRQNNDTSKVTPARPAQRRRSSKVVDREAALDAEAAKMPKRKRTAKRSAK